jgi:ArsR family transcriptional regulator
MMMKFTADCCDCFAGLATKARVGIVNLLLEKGKLSVMEIGKHFRLKQPTITHHLHYLKEAGIVDSKKEGRKVYYFISQKCREGRCKLFS